MVLGRQLAAAAERADGPAAVRSGAGSAGLADQGRAEARSRRVVGDRRAVPVTEREDVPAGGSVELSGAGHAGVQHGDRLVLLRRPRGELLSGEPQPAHAADGRADDRVVRRSARDGGDQQSRPVGKRRV